MQQIAILIITFAVYVAGIRNTGSTGDGDSKAQIASGGGNAGAIADYERWVFVCVCGRAIKSDERIMNNAKSCVKNLLLILMVILIKVQKLLGLIWSYKYAEQ